MVNLKEFADKSESFSKEIRDKGLGINFWPKYSITYEDELTQYSDTMIPTILEATKGKNIQVDTEDGITTIIVEDAKSLPYEVRKEGYFTYRLLDTQINISSDVLDVLIFAKADGEVSGKVTSDNGRYGDGFDLENLSKLTEISAYTKQVLEKYRLIS